MSGLRVVRAIKPWVGSRYEDGLKHGLRLLVVGDSHYDEAEQSYPDLTVDVVNELGITQPYRFFEALRSISSGTGEAPAPEIFWNSVAFCNFVQDVLPFANANPTADQLARGYLALLQTIEQIHPDVMFVFSRRAWDAMPYELAPSSGQRRSANIDADIPGVYRYERDGGKPLVAAVFNHPSRLNVSEGVWRAWADHAWSRAMRSLAYR